MPPTLDLPQLIPVVCGQAECILCVRGVLCARRARYYLPLDPIPHMPASFFMYFLFVLSTMFMTTNTTMIPVTATF